MSLNISRAGRALALAGTAVALAACAPASPTGTPTEGAAWITRQTRQMGTVCTVRVRSAQRGVGLIAIESAFAAIEAAERFLSTWRDDTEFARLNATPPGQTFPASAPLLELWPRLEDLREKTGGAFDPAVGRLVAAWDLRGQGRIPSQSDLRAAHAATGLDLFRREGEFLRRLPPGALLDAGGFGKGYGLDLAGRALSATGIEEWTIDFGGQVLVSSHGVHETGVAHPDERRTPVGRMQLQGVSAATSAQGVRGRRVGETLIGHVLDPRTGRPASWEGSVTVVHPEAMTADALATALLVLGPDEGLALARTVPRLEALFLFLQDGRLTARMTDGMRPLLRDLEVEDRVESPR